MADDIQEQAAQRRMRRLKKAPENNELMDSIGRKQTTGRDEINSLSPRSQTNGSTPRGRRSQSYETGTNSGDLEMLSIESQPSLPPFIRCECGGIELKALINTVEANSKINSAIVDKCNLLVEGAQKKHSNNPERLPNVNLNFGKKATILSCEIEDDIPANIIIGNDFLTKYKCIINYGEKTVHIGGSDGTMVAFLQEREIPLKFRWGGASVSI